MQALASRLATAPRAPWPDRPLPIALVITELDPGGAEKALVALATRIDRRRWSPTVIALGPEAELVAPLRAAGIRVTCLGLDRRHPWRAVTGLVQAFRSVRPILVQSYLFHANVAARLAARVTRRPVPWVLGGLRVAEPRRWQLDLDRRTFPLSAGSVCVSRGVLEHSVKVGGLPRDRLVVIPNGVDTAAFDATLPMDREALGWRGPLALFVGRLDSQKGLSCLLEAARIVAGTRPDWGLAIVGEGPLGPDLKRFEADHPELDGRLLWLGRRSDVPSLLKSADLFVLPSLWEGMPNVVLEAMAAWKAVIGTTVEGTEDLIRPGETGWLVPPADPAQLAAAILDAHADPVRLDRFGRAGRARVEAEFGWDRAARSYQSLWSRLIGLNSEVFD